MEEPSSRIIIGDYRRGDRLPAALVVLQCLTHPEIVSNIPAAEVWYKTCAFPDPDRGGKGTVELWAKWPCSACNQEHEGRMAKW